MASAVLGLLFVIVVLLFGCGEELPTLLPPEELLLLLWEEVGVDELVVVASGVGGR